MTTAADHSHAPRQRPGHGALSVQSVAGHSAATTVRSASPLKLLVPRPRGPSVWAYTSSFGGGLVAGDQTRLDLRIDPGTRCFLGTQASTKIYRDPHRRASSHETLARLGNDALLVFAPDPVQAFADSSYSQRQEFHLGPGASLVLLDWFTAGRTARGERWAFRSFRSRNAVYQHPHHTPVGTDDAPGAEGLAEGRGAGAGRADVDVARGDLMFLDALALTAEDGPIASPHRTGRHACFATLFLAGPAVAALAREILEALARLPVLRQAPLLAVASPVRDGVVVRVAGEEVEAVGRELHRWLAPLAAPLGDDPWARKW